LHVTSQLFKKIQSKSVRKKKKALHFGQQEESILHEIREEIKPEEKLVELTNVVLITLI